jgi:N-acetylmuramoyl-L-alanine amidase
MKFGIDPGHLLPPDTGAEGFEIEQNLNKDIADELSWLLIDAGVEVINCLPTVRVKSVDESLKMRCSIANAAILYQSITTRVVVRELKYSLSAHLGSNWLKQY